MARPFKQGLDYFSFDVDFFDNLKIRKILRGCGPGAGSILTCLLCNIYRGKGYYIEWNEDLPFDIADKVGVAEGSVSEVIIKAVQVDFFDQYQYQQNKILTSEEIQKRYKAGTLKRHEIIIEELFVVNSEKKRINGGNNPVNGGDNPQSKVKDSKVKKSKVDAGADAPAQKSFKEFTEQDFIDEISRFKDEFSYEIRNGFFKHWKEKSAGGKMRFQLEKTWETNLRLEKWKSNQLKFSSNGTNKQITGKPVSKNVSSGGFGRL